MCPSSAVNGNLALPRVAPDVPAFHDIGGAGNADAHLARALLDAGIINDDEDWNGDLMESLEAGLKRWVNVTCECAGLRAIQVDIGISSVLDGAYAEADEWIREYDGLPLPVGCLAIEGDGFNYVYVERAVRAMEARQKGLGWAVLDLVECALGRTIGVASPAWALSFLDAFGWEEEEEYEEEEDEDAPGKQGSPCEEDGFPTHAKLRGSVPPEMLQANYKPDFEARIERGLRNRGFSQEDKKLLRDALELHHLLPRTQEVSFRDQHCFSELEQVLPCGIRWNADDALPQICDMYHDDLANSGMQSFVVFFQGFQFGATKNTVGDAFRNMQLCLQIVGRASRLLEAMDGDPVPLSRSATLLEILGGTQVIRR